MRLNTRAHTRIRVRVRVLGCACGRRVRGAPQDVWSLEVRSESTTLRRPRSTLTHSIVPHLASLIGSPRFSDVDIALPDGGAPIPAHSLILCSGASKYFAAALEGPFAEAAQAAASGRATLRLPAPLARDVVMDVLRWLYTGAITGAGAGTEASGTGATGPWVGAAAAAGTGLAAASSTSERTVERAVELLVAADALDIEGLRQQCEHTLACALTALPSSSSSAAAAAADDDDDSDGDGAAAAGDGDDSGDQTLELLLLAEQLHCTRLREFCLAQLEHRYGAWQRQLESPPSGRQLRRARAWWLCTPPMNQAADDVLADIEAADADAVRALGGFEQLSRILVAELEARLGLTDGALQRCAAMDRPSPHDTSVQVSGVEVEATGAEVEAIGAELTSAEASAVLREGDVVEVHSLAAREDLNGQLGWLQCFYAPTARWVCILRSSNSLGRALDPPRHATHSHSYGELLSSPAHAPAHRAPPPERETVRIRADNLQLKWRRHSRPPPLVTSRSAP